MRRLSGSALLVVLLCSLLCWNYTRGVILQDDTPVPFAEPLTQYMVCLGEGFPISGVHQFLDGQKVKDVIILAGCSLADELASGDRIQQPLEPGQRIDLVIKGAVVEDFFLSWLPASQRIALGIPLHPDRMTVADWQALPGIGEKTAARIESNRQKYGDFVEFSALNRVSGVGPAKLARWSEFFN